MWQQHGGDVYGREGVLDFSASINPMGMPEQAAEALRQSVRCVGQYPDPACRALREAIGRARGLDPEMIVCGNGAAELILALARAIRPSRSVLFAPCFSEYARALSVCALQPEYVLCRPDSDFRLPQPFERVIPEDAGAVFVCNPQNPAGVCSGRDDLLRLLEVCERRGAVLILDECFLPLVSGDPGGEGSGRGAGEAERSLLPFAAEHPGLVVLRSFTKLYAMPGLRLGYAVLSDGKLRGKLKENLPAWNVSAPASAAGIAALQSEQEGFTGKTLALTGAGRRQLREGLFSLEIRDVWGEANYLLLRGPEGLAEKLLERGILIRDCRSFPGLSPGYYRIAVRKEEENRALLDALSEVVIWQKQS